MTRSFVWPLILVASPAAAPALAQESPVDVVNPFAKNYLTVEVARNYPLSFALDRYEPGPLHPVIGYRHDLDEHWVMGIGGQFKILGRKDETRSRELALWSFYHETLYALRLDHPTYLLLGPKLNYLLPAEAARLPLQRDDSLVTEIGVSLSVSLARVTNWGMWTLRVDRWRGTTTNKLHAVEVALGGSIALR